MTHEEKRNEARSGITLEDHHNLFFLEKDNDRQAIVRIRDVSISGVGINMNQPLDASMPVSLTYDSDDFKLTINGITAWCNPVEEGNSFDMGIQFNANDPNDNSLFFLAVRKYLDDFDGGTFDA